MEKLDITTTQNVDIEYTIASLGDRIVAQIIDLVILFGYTLISFFIFTFVFDSFSFGFPIALMVLLFLPAFFYDFLCEAFMNGQSFGKKIMKIKVVKVNGSQPRLINYFLRWILKPIEVYIAYGSVALITILINGRGQRVGDLAGNTTVIKLKKYVKLDELILPKIVVDRKIVYPQVSGLNDEDIRVIQEVILYRKNADILVFSTVLEKLKIKMEEKLNVIASTDSLTFLSDIMKDYEQINYQ
jgi:uncharacterized RDD family membrane protein YckC